ncbi:MFS transporter [Nocardia sp. NPDC004860]|uniref:MFS transporter n=1 Tax=Nocardia sp. NPDC004860 TaxID=3154557 RepID=UPI0033A926D7
MCVISVRRLIRRPGARFAVLTNRNFRLFVAGQIASVTGTWMMVAAQDWLVLDTTHNSAFALAMLTVCQFSPAVFLPMVAGVIADRMPKRNILLAANTIAAVLTSIQAGLVVAGRVELWQLYVLAGGIGVVNAIETPTRMAFITEIVGDETFRDASSLSAMYFSVAQLLGPAAAGVMIGAFGTGSALAVNSASYLATVAGLWAMRPGELVPITRARRESTVAQGFRHIIDNSDMIRSVILLAAVGFFAINLRVTAPLLARTEFHATPTEFGFITASMAGGSLFAALFIGGRHRPSFRAAAGFAAVLGGAEVVLGWTTVLPAALLLLFTCGIAMTAFLQSTNHHLQLSSRPEFRGRVIAVYTMIIQGITPLAALAVGVLAHRIGLRPVICAGGLAAVVSALGTVAGHGKLRPHPWSRV